METGTHNELMNKKSFYYNFVMLQTIAEEVAKESDNVSIVSGEERGEKILLFALKERSLFLKRQDISGN